MYEKKKKCTKKKRNVRKKKEIHEKKKTPTCEHQPLKKNKKSNNDFPAHSLQYDQHLKANAVSTGIACREPRVGSGIGFHTAMLKTTLIGLRGLVLLLNDQQKTRVSLAPGTCPRAPTKQNRPNPRG